MIYLDYNATAPLFPSVIEAMAQAMASPANPSSAHALGRKAKSQLEQSREVVADVVSAWPNEVIFTASGTEANNMILRGFEGRPLLVGATEHTSVQKLAARLGGDVLPVDGHGLIDLEILESKLKSLGVPALVSVMLANNETGIIQPLDQISAIVRRYDGLIHTDAVQALGKIPFDMGTLGVDAMTLCAHKSGGPVGVGALILRNDLAIKPLLIGGGQELNRRASTENVPAIVGFAEAVRVARLREWVPQVENWIGALEDSIRRISPGVVIVGADTARLANTACILMPHVPSETQLMSFDLDGVCVSAGSACSSGRIEVSHVLKAMGYSESQAKTAIRISAGWNTTQEDILKCGQSWEKIYSRIAKKAA